MCSLFMILVRNAVETDQAPSPSRCRPSSPAAKAAAKAPRNGPSGPRPANAPANGNGPRAMNGMTYGMGMARGLVRIWPLASPHDLGVG